MLVSLLAMLSLTACTGSPDTGDTSTYAPLIDPATFSSTVDNPLYPLTPGTTLVRIENGANEMDFEVTSDLRTVMGVDCVVVHDVLKAPDGTTLEDTYDWFAQNDTGDVWYFGEDTTAYDESGNNPDKEGSWEGGVGGAYPGIIMEAAPQVGDSYRSEYLPGVAEDTVEVVSLDASVTVPYGSFTGCLETHETTPVEPGLVEQKDYVSGIGEVNAADIAGGSDTEQLSEVRTAQ